MGTHTYCTYIRDVMGRVKKTTRTYECKRQEVSCVCLCVCVSYVRQYEYNNTCMAYMHALKTRGTNVSEMLYI